MLRRIKGFTLIELLIVVAIIAILAAIAVPNFLEAQTRSKVSRARADQRTVATALEAYYIDNNSYPAASSLNDQTSTNGVNAYSSFPSATTQIKSQLTFKFKSNTENVATLTTPIAYITSFSGDPFVDTKGATFAYSTAPYAKAGWLIWSYGPDSDETTDLSDAKNHPGATIYSNMVACGGDIGSVEITGYPTAVSETFYNPDIKTPSDNLTLYGTYDPSNGTTSGGDVWRVKQ